MQLLLGVPSLQAHSMLMYADWRHVIAEFCAHRLGLDEGDHLPQTIGWLCLGTALAAYEQWLAHPDADLDALIRAGCATLAAGLQGCECSSHAIDPATDSAALVWSSMPRFAIDGFAEPAPRLDRCRRETGRRRGNTGDTAATDRPLPWNRSPCRCRQPDI